MNMIHLIWVIPSVIIVSGVLAYLTRGSPGDPLFGIDPDISQRREMIDAIERLESILTRIEQKLEK